MGPMVKRIQNPKWTLITVGRSYASCTKSELWGLWNSELSYAVRGIEATTKRAKKWGPDLLTHGNMS